MYNVQTTPTFVLLRGGIRLYQLETPDVIELEEKIKTFRFQAPPKIRLVKSVQEKPRVSFHAFCGVGPKILVFEDMVIMYAQN